MSAIQRFHCIILFMYHFRLFFAVFSKQSNESPCILYASIVRTHHLQIYKMGEAVTSPNMQTRLDTKDFLKEERGWAEGVLKGLLKCFQNKLLIDFRLVTYLKHGIHQICFWWIFFFLRQTLKLYHKNTSFKYVLMKSFYYDFACLLSSKNSYIYLFTFYFLLHTWHIWRPYKVLPQYC